MVHTGSINPDVQKFLDAFNQMMQTMPAEMPIEMGRQAYETFAMVHSGVPLSMRRVDDMTITARDGQTEIPIRLYYPRLVGERLPLLVYYHGGGWQRGSINAHDSICRHLALKADCGVLSVGWRLAPEHRFPTGTYDCLDAYLWARAHADQLGFDAHRIGMGGDSAGGNMTGSVLLRLLSSGEKMPCYHALFYPSLDLSCSYPSYDQFKEGFFLSSDRVRYYVRHYLDTLDQINDPYVSPLKAPDLSAFPPALVVTAEFDPLKDEGAAYAARLQEYGIPTQYICAEGMIHAFLHMTHTVPAVGAFFDRIGPIIGAGLRAPHP